MNPKKSTAELLRSVLFDNRSTTPVPIICGCLRSVKMSCGNNMIEQHKK